MGGQNRRKRNHHRGKANQNNKRGVKEFEWDVEGGKDGGKEKFWWETIQGYTLVEKGNFHRRKKREGGVRPHKKKKRGDNPGQIGDVTEGGEQWRKKKPWHKGGAKEALACRSQNRMVNVPGHYKTKTAFSWEGDVFVCTVTGRINLDAWRSGGVNAEGLAGVARMNVDEQVTLEKKKSHRLGRPEGQK